MNYRRTLAHEKDNAGELKISIVQGTYFQNLPDSGALQTFCNRQ